MTRDTLSVSSILARFRDDIREAYIVLDYAPISAAAEAYTLMSEHERVYFLVFPKEDRKHTFDDFMDQFEVPENVSAIFDIEDNAFGAIGINLPIPQIAKYALREVDEITHLVVPVRVVSDMVKLVMMSVPLHDTALYELVASVFRKSIIRMDDVVLEDFGELLYKCLEESKAPEFRRVLERLKFTRILQNRWNLDRNFEENERKCLTEIEAIIANGSELPFPFPMKNGTVSMSEPAKWVKVIMNGALVITTGFRDLEDIVFEDKNRFDTFSVSGDESYRSEPFAAFVEALKSLKSEDFPLNYEVARRIFDVYKNPGDTRFYFPEA